MSLCCAAILGSDKSTRTTYLLSVLKCSFNNFQALGHSFKSLVQTHIESTSSDRTSLKYFSCSKNIKLRVQCINVKRSKVITLSCIEHETWLLSSWSPDNLRVSPGRVINKRWNLVSNSRVFLLSPAILCFLCVFSKLSLLQVGISWSQANSL